MRNGNCDAVDPIDYSYKDGKLDIEETHSEGSFDDESVWNYHFQLIDGVFTKIPE